MRFSPCKYGMKAQSEEIKNFTLLIKSIVGIFYAYLVFLICYLPYFICMAVIRICGSSIVLKKLYLFSLTLMYLNSSLNPIIYCWKMRHIQHAIMDILRKMSWEGNRPFRIQYNGHQMSSISITDPPCVAYKDCAQ